MARRRNTGRSIHRIPVEFMAEGEARDLRNYFLAIRSYPEQLAVQPYIDFQQHLLSVMGENRVTHGRRPSAE